MQLAPVACRRGDDAGLRVEADQGHGLACLDGVDELRGSGARLLEARRSDIGGLHGGAGVEQDHRVGAGRLRGLHEWPCDGADHGGQRGDLQQQQQRGRHPPPGSLGFEVVQRGEPQEGTRHPPRRPPRPQQIGGQDGQQQPRASDKRRRS